MRLLFLVLFCLVSLNVFAYPLTPNRNMTPGHMCNDEDPDFMEYRYPEQVPICRRNVSSWRKRQIYEAYNILYEDHDSYTIDHLIPRSILGSNFDENLWPEHLDLKRHRMGLEFDLYLALRRGQILASTAVRVILNSKFDRDLLKKRPYRDYKGLMDYIEKREPSLLPLFRGLCQTQE